MSGPGSLSVHNEVRGVGEWGSGVVGRREGGGVAVQTSRPSWDWQGHLGTSS